MEIFDVVFEGVVYLYVFGILAGVIAYFVGKCKFFSKCGYSGFLALIPIVSDFFFLYKICQLHIAFFIITALVTLFVTEQTIWVMIARAIIKGLAWYNFAKKADMKPLQICLLGIVLNGPLMFVLGLFTDFNYDESIEVSDCGPF